MPAPQVAHTAEFQRISSLPRRVWAEDDLRRLACELSGLLKTSSGTQILRPIQALALHDAGLEGGLFGSVGVGDGKTLISFMLPLVWGAKRPLLLNPGGLIEKTQRDRITYSKHWSVPSSLRVFSYDMLGRVQAADELEAYQPDAIICDEVHRLKNKKAAVTRRVARYMYDHPYTKFAGFSGSVMDKSLKEFAHILRWALKTKAPIPITTEEIEEWAEALDQGVDPMVRRNAGALMELCSAGERSEYPEHIAARHGFRRRLTETRGVVATIGEGESVGASIYVRGIRHKVTEATERNFTQLRTKQETPDGGQFANGVDAWRHAQELALGLYYRWNPPPPDDWLDARRAWGQFVRATISHGKKYDSELHIANAVDAGELAAGVEALTKWREIKPTFEPNVEAVWCDDSALEACATWAKDPGLIWTEHHFFAARLAEYTGLPYYGAGGFSAAGKYIEDHPTGTSAIASLDANCEGKNLQGIWSRNLLVCPPPSAKKQEQMIARTHRTGQAADEVTVDVLLGCRENFDAMLEAVDRARGVEQMTGKRQKLLMATVILPSVQEIDGIGGDRWTR